MRGSSMTTNEMPGKFRISVPNRTFSQRLRSQALWWGVPAACAELFWVPRNLWLYALIFIIPATAVGVVTGAVILHVAAARRSNASDEGNAST
jgi:hypothetical protein